MGEHNGFAWSGTYDEQVRAAYRLIARHVYPFHGMGDFAYRAFEHINAEYFDGRLPEPLIVWDITNYGNCLGWTRSPEDGPPIIKLHPSLIAPVDDNPWDVPAALLGYCYAFHVLLHETVHAAVNYLHGGIESHPGYKSKWTSHANPLWIAEINRISALMGVAITYDMKRYRRVPTGELTAKGKRETTVAWGCDGPEPEHWPQNLPGAEKFYRAKNLPFDWERKSVVRS